MGPCVSAMDPTVWVCGARQQVAQSHTTMLGVFTKGADLSSVRGFNLEDRVAHDFGEAGIAEHHGLQFPIYTGDFGELSMVAGSGVVSI